MAPLAVESLHQIKFTAKCAFIKVWINHQIRSMLHVNSRQEAHKPYRSPEKHFQPINVCNLQNLCNASYNDYTITLIKRKKNHNLLFENWMVLYLQKNWVPFTQGCFVPRLGGAGEDFLNFVNVFSLFHFYLPLEEGVTLHLNKLKSPSPKNFMCHVWLKLV